MAGLDHVTLLYFASIRTSLPDAPDSASIPLPTTPCSLSSLRAYLTSTIHPDNDEFATALTRSEWSVDEEMVPRESEPSVWLNGGETICAIPPVSGG